MPCWMRALESNTIAMYGPLAPPIPNGPQDIASTQQATQETLVEEDKI